MFTQPEWSPWGKVQVCDPLCPGIYLVSTAGHGGTMVTPDMIPILSSAARKCGMRQNGWLCFEEDSEESIVLRERQAGQERAARLGASAPSRGPEH